MGKHSAWQVAALWVAACCLLTCRRAEMPSYPPGQFSAEYWGTVEGTRNGLPLLSPRISAFLPTEIYNFPCQRKTFGFYMAEYSDDGCLRTGLSFGRLKRQVKTYTGSELSGNILENCERDTVPYVQFSYWECDVAGNPYALIDTVANRLEVHEYSEATGRVVGFYDLLMRARQQLPPDWPVTVRFTGRFETKLRTTQFYQ